MKPHLTTPIERSPVESSLIHSIGHCPETNTLEVAFHGKDGPTVWRYGNVTPEDHEALMRAPSVGKHFHQRIRGQARHPHHEMK